MRLYFYVQPLARAQVGTSIDYLDYVPGIGNARFIWIQLHLPRFGFKVEVSVYSLSTTIFVERVHIGYGLVLPAMDLVV